VLPDASWFLRDYFVHYFVCVCELVPLAPTRHFLPGLECSLHQPGFFKTRTLPETQKRKQQKKQKSEIAADTAEKDSNLADRKENNANVVASLDAKT